MQAVTSPERFRRDFAFRGLVLGAGSFIPGVGGLVVLSALQRFGEEVTASYGFALSVYGLVAVLCSGHGIAAVARLSRSIAAGESTSRQRLVFAELVATALAATATLIILAALVGTVVLVSGDVDKPTFVAAYSSLLIGSFLFPVGQAIAGWQQVRGEDVRMLQYTVESTVTPPSRQPSERTETAALAHVHHVLGDHADRNTDDRHAKAGRRGARHPVIGGG